MIHFLQLVVDFIVGSISILSTNGLKPERLAIVCMTVLVVDSSRTPFMCLCCIELTRAQFVLCFNRRTFTYFVAYYGLQCIQCSAESTQVTSV